MEAQLRNHLALLLGILVSCGAGFRTENFVVRAEDPAMARVVGEEAERLRKELAEHWLGRPLPRWQDPCPIDVHAGPTLGAGGQTSFAFSTQGPFGWEMMVQGTRERILDSVLPHEITHTIFATHFGRPLPRWADEGACTTVEHIAERSKQRDLLIQFLRTDRGIAFNKMFAMRDYPSDILPLYSQGYSLARYLIQQGGPQKFMEYVGAGMRTNNWTVSTKQHYGFDSLGDLQTAWLAWVKQGSPKMSADVANVSVPSDPTTSDEPAEPTQPTTSEPAPIQLATPFLPGSTGRIALISHAVASNDEQAEPSAQATAAETKTDSGRKSNGPTSGSWYLDQAHRQAVSRPQRPQGIEPRILRQHAR